MKILAIIRKLILCVGLFASALLSVYPHWRVSLAINDHKFDYGIGRSFISSPPNIKPYELAELAGLNERLEDSMGLAIVKAVDMNYRVHYFRQIVEVVLSLLFTFGLLWAFRERKERLLPGT